MNAGAPSITGWKQTAPMAEHDPALVWSALALLLIGLVMVYSSSIATAEASKYTSYQASYFLLRQALFLGVGFAVGVVAYQIPLAT